MYGVSGGLGSFGGSESGGGCSGGIVLAGSSGGVGGGSGNLNL
jgi:hypothetical protein